MKLRSLLPRPYPFFKYTTDKLLALTALLALAPLLTAIAAAIRLSSPGPIFFRQQRLGLHQKPFTIFKFRTMHTHSQPDIPLLASTDDPRITPLGSFLRRYRLDELPQFFNVLIGDMSLVGPRPEQQFFAELIAQHNPQYLLLFNLRPGITSLGMIKFGYASTLPQMLRRLNYDLLYYHHRSLLLDAAILLLTLRTVLAGKGI
ncbi:MAG: sugar transferase [Tannerellaceae bacterium]|jgi:lipopolysaccharide/colanic/teichoic acid biosynthesis glycosyltransferase|nr:sugar transferase [Tannerellaceae bacterium]